MLELPERTRERERERARVAAAEPLNVSIPEAAALLGVSPSTVRNGIRRGEIRPVRLVGRVLVPRAEIERIQRGDPPAERAS